MDFKRVFGFVLLFAFIGFMGSKLFAGVSHLNDDFMIYIFVFTVVLLLVLVVRKILLS